VNQSTREVVLRGPDGNSVTVTAGPEVRNLAQVRRGDRVVVTYGAALAVEMAPPGGGGPPAEVATGMARAEPGERPAGAVGQRVRARVRIQEVDPVTGRVAFVGPQGVRRVVTPQNAAMADFAKARELVVVVDNTFATPYLQRPLSLGADLVVHSTTKYLGGHSDLIGGAVISRRSDLMEKVRFLQNATGGVPSPMDCYLLLRGLKTLEVRMERHCANARRLAEALSEMPGASRVLYPGLAHHPGHTIVPLQMSGFGGMVSLELEGDAERAHVFCSKLKVFALAESLCGVESLCCHPATMTHASIPAEVRQARGISDSLIRLSVGIEDVTDLIEDIQQAL